MLNREETKDFYDRFGAMQDWQSFYENKAIEILVEHSGFGSALSLFEFGCGTGAFAKELLKNQVNKECKYLGIDLSETMVELTKRRLRPFRNRAEVRLSDGSTKLPFRDNAFERFVTNYVLDLLNNKEIMEVFSEAHRILKKDGLLSITSLACGEGFVSSSITKIWENIHRLNPTFVGGCRPLNLAEFVNEGIWEINHHSKISSFGITSEVLVVRNR